jgi:anaerobic selenocysteine-containing dehydrogenase
VVSTDDTGAVVRIDGDHDHFLLRGYTCPKGRMLGALHSAANRLDDPLLRGRDDGMLHAVEWNAALDDLSSRLAAVHAEHGPDAIALYIGTAIALDAAGVTTAERFLQGLGSRSRYTTLTVDSVAKVLVPRLMAGREWLFPALDLERTTLAIVVGQNTVVSHGAFGYLPDPVRYLRAIKDRGELWVLDPRRTETARLAGRHLAPRVGTDYAVLAHLARALLREGVDGAYVDRHTRSLPALRAAVERYDRATTTAVTGLDGRDLDDLVAAVRRHDRLAVVTGTGVTMTAAANVTEWLAWVVQILTGSFERPGGKWFNPGMAGPPPGGAAPVVPPPLHPGPPSRPELPRIADQYPLAALRDEIEAGNVRALLVFGGNPAVALPDGGPLAGALATLDVLACWDVVPTATTALATHVLPSLDALERADVLTTTILPATMTQYTPAVVAPIGQRRAVWRSTAELAARMGLEVLPDGVDAVAGADEDVLAAIADRARVPFSVLRDADGPVALEHGEPWVVDRVLPEGRWDLAPPALVAQLERAAARAVDDLVLINRREVRHTNSTFTAVAGVDGVVPRVHLNPIDAEAAGVVDGSVVRVVSATGELEGIVRVEPGLARGAVSIPHGYADVNVGCLTTATTGVDELSGMPTQSGVPIRLERVG